MEILDALGNPIDFGGQKYGYAQNANGHTTTFIGTAVKRTESGKITVSVEKRFTALYNDNVKQDGGPPYRTISCKPNMLIPTL